MLSRPSRKRAHEPDVDTGGGGHGGGDNVRVVVRIRPENEKERQGNYRIIVQAVDENVLVFDPKEQSSYDFGSRKRPRDIRKRPNKDLKFAFDRVFGPDAENTDIYQETTQSVLTGLLNGYNCSVFAYGATGAGKTFTMLGSSDKPGVMYHTMIDLYSRIDNMKDTKTCDVAVSYLEVYNEQIRDLLMPSQQFLPIREDPSAGVLIPGLSLHKPKTAEEILYMLQFGNQHRTQHPTDANAESSRSHAVFQVFVRQTDRTANISAEVRVAKLCLVDLAGSERATVTKNRGSRFREGANINRSLLALGNVINALAENKRKGFVPYRDSKLTRLLKDSLGGNCQTVMIAAVSPSAMTFEDTYNTLRYADRAKHIKASLKKNVLNVDFHVAKYGKIVEELRKEIKELKGKLLEAESCSVPGQVTGHVTDQAPQAVLPSFVGYQNDIVDYFTSHQSVRSKQLQEEITLRNLQWTTYRKERCLARLNAFSEPQSSEYMTSVQNQLSLLRQKSSCLEITSRSSRSQLEDSCRQLGHLETKMAATKGPDNRLPEVLCQLVQSQSLRCEVQDLRQYVAFIKQVVRAQERELIHNERLVHLLLQLLNREHQLLQDHNLVTQYLHEAYTQVGQLSSGQELTWHDQGPNTTYSRGYTLQTMLELPSLGLKPAWSDPSSLSYSLPQGMTDSQCPVPSSQHPASNPVPQPPSVPEVYHFNANPPAPHTQQEAKRPFMDIKVDECSPPKPKRVLLPAKETRPLPSHHRNRHHSNSRNGNKLRAYSSASNLLSQNINPQRLSVPSSIDSSPDLEEDVETPSKFSKVFDTITKCKKFSHLHTGSSQQEESTKVDSLNETFTVDETYVINTAVCSNPVQLTCPVIEGTQCVGQCKTGPIFNPSEIHISPVTLGQCSCSHNLSVTGSQSVTTQGYGQENDSGASTIVDQSASSQSSVVSIMTLVDGPQNLSQNLSTDECKDGEVHSTGSVSEQTSSIVAGNSNCRTPSEMQQDVGTNKVTESNKTPIKGKSYAAALTSPSPDRPPLRQMGDPNRPVQANDALRQQKVSKERLSAQSSRRGSRELKENSQKLDKLGLPSLMDLGLHKDKKAMKKNQSMTPGYMQATKAHVQRKTTETARSRMRSKSVSNLSARTAWQI